MLSNIKIRYKLAIGFGTLLVLIIIMAALAVHYFDQMRDENAYILDFPSWRLSYLESFGGEMNDLRRIAVTIAFSPGNDSLIGSLEQEAIMVLGVARELVDSFEASINNDPQVVGAARNPYLQSAASLRDAVARYEQEVLQAAIAAARANNAAAAQGIREHDVALYDYIRSIYYGMEDMQVTAMFDSQQDLNAMADGTSVMLVIITVIALAVGIAVAILITASITKPVNEILGVLEDVAKGDLHVNIRAGSKDEMGQLADSTRMLVKTIRHFITEVDTVANLHHKGDVSVFIDESKYSGEYKNMAEHVNFMLKDYLGDLRDTVQIFSEIAAGNFDTKLRQFPGDMAYVNEAVDAVNAQLQKVEDGIVSMIDAAAVKGDLLFHIDSSKFAGDWKDIMDGLNKIAEAVDAPVVEIRRVMEHLSKGDFSQRVEGDFAGDFKAIKDAVNGTIDVQSSYAREIVMSLSEISGGNLTKTITMDFQGDFNAMKEGINGIATSLNKTMSEISSASSQVLAGAKQISTSAMELANGASTQASSVQELNASIDIINQQTRQNAENASEADTLSTRSASNAAEGNDAMKHMLDAMLQIKESSNNISRIIKVIQDIAFQTNLLSLNAAVEAARAGEHGKGFSVVAEEVRNLAARSQTAATETTTLIEDSINRVEVGSGIAESTSGSLDTIVKNVGEVSSIINAISRASQEQAEAISQIGMGLSQISQVVQSNSAVSEETAAAAEELNSQAEILQQLVSYFKV